MDIKERRLLNKIKRSHYQLLEKLHLGDKKENEVQKLFCDYHNELNLKILTLENNKEKQSG